MSKVKAGDKIKLKKEMGPLTDIGTICTVKEIDSHGNIIFSNKNLLGTLGLMTEDELDKYFEIMKLDELNSNDLNDTIENLKAQLEKYEKAITERKKEKKKKFYLIDLEPGDVFEDEYGSRYIIVKHFYIQRKTLAAFAKDPFNKDQLILFTSDSYVKKIDDQN